MEKVFAIKSKSEIEEILLEQIRKGKILLEKISKLDSNDEGIHQYRSDCKSGVLLIQKFC